VQNSHPAIIEPEEWDLVQAEIARRKELGSRYHSNNIFTGTIICGDCGGQYGPKLWHSTDQYRRTVWQCCDKFRNEHKCKTPHFSEEQFKELFMKAFGQLISMRESILEDCLLIQAKLFDCKDLDSKQDRLEDELEMTTEMMRRCIEENSVKAQDQAEYIQRYDFYSQKYEKLKKKLDALLAERQRRKEHYDLLGGFIDMLRQHDQMPLVFDVGLWVGTVDHATVYNDHRVVFTFKGGVEITEEI
jgi:hypothetical protein